MDPITPGPGGFITTAQAAALCGVSPVTVRNWVNRGWHTDDGVKKMPVAFRYGGRLMLDPHEVAKAERATAERARRHIQPTAA